MKKLTVEQMGEEVQGVRLRGDPKTQPEPTHFRVVLPCGADVDVARCDDGTYWIHIRMDRPGDSADDGERVNGVVLDARADVHGKHASETPVEHLGDPGLYHLAVRVGPAPRKERG